MILNKILHFLRATVTPIGRVLVFVTIAGFVLGLTFGWIELTVPAVVSFVLLILALPFLFGAMPFEINFLVNEKRIIAGTKIVAELEIKNLSKRKTLAATLDLPVNDEIFSIPVKSLHKKTKEKIVIPEQKRGILKIGPAKIVREDPLHIFKREKAWKKTFTVFIHPITVDLKNLSSGTRKDLEGQTTNNIINDDLEFHAVRQWQSGDLKRQIHWKSTAKTGALMVKQFEETRVSETLIILDTLLENYADDEEFELSVSAAASVALLEMRQNQNVEVFHAMEKEITTIKAHNKEPLLDAFSAIRAAQTGSSLSDCAKFAAKTIFQPSLVIILSGSKLSAKKLQLLSLAFSKNTEILVIISDLTTAPKQKFLNDTTVFNIGILEDLKQLFVRSR